MSLDEYAKMVLGLQELIRSLRQTIEGLRTDLAKRDAEVAQLRRAQFGQRRERIKPLEREVVRAIEISADAKRAKTQARRKATAEQQAELPEVEVIHTLAAAQEHCPHCEGPFRALGDGEQSFEFDFVPSRFVRRRHIRQRKVCRCGETIVVAPAPNRVADGVKYGPGLHAHVAVAKCADAMPLHRQAKALRRGGVPITPSSLGDMFHRAADLLRPLADLVMQEVAQSGYVNADETPVRVVAPGKTRRAYAWTFVGGGQVAYRYSPTRSGETPKNLLEGRRGFLQVDNYTGYNKTCAPDGWTRVGCLAHVRRYFFEAQETEPEAAQEAMERILAVYRVEHEASERNINGTAAHLELRQRKSRPLMDSLHAWLLEQRGHFRPKSPMGKAITYALNGWSNLLEFLNDARLALDNNVSERALRIVALGRKNFLFVGNDEAGKNLAVLQTLIGCCDLAGVNPQDYLADVLIQIQHHPARAAVTLLPRCWKDRQGKSDAT